MVESMHELGIISSMVKTIEQIVHEQGLTKVQKLVLEVGELSGVVPRYMEECYPAAVYKTFMQDTELELETVPGIVHCRNCGREFNAMQQDFVCPECGSQDLEILAGNDVIIKEILCL